MGRMFLIFFLVILLSGCTGLPTVETTPTPIQSRVLPTQTATDVLKIVTVTGNVYVRDNQGNGVGWLYKDEQVNAICRGDWCVIDEGKLKGNRFWRGCSSDNPQHKSCQAK